MAFDIAVLAAREAHLSTIVELLEKNHDRTARFNYQLEDDEDYIAFIDQCATDIYTIGARRDGGEPYIMGFCYLSLLFADNGAVLENVRELHIYLFRDTLRARTALRVVADHILNKFHPEIDKLVVEASDKIPELAGCLRRISYGTFTTQELNAFDAEGRPYTTYRLYITRDHLDFYATMKARPSQNGRRAPNDEHIQEAKNTGSRKANFNLLPLWIGKLFKG